MKPRASEIASGGFTCEYDYDEKRALPCGLPARVEIHRLRLAGAPHVYRMCYGHADRAFPQWRTYEPILADVAMRAVKVVTATDALVIAVSIGSDGKYTVATLNKAHGFTVYSNLRRVDDVRVGDRVLAGNAVGEATAAHVAHGDRCDVTFDVR